MWESFRSEAGRIVKEEFGVEKSEVTRAVALER
jgi:hypothetical protein